MAGTSVVRIPRKGQKNDFVLVHTEQKNADEFKLLLDATESENAYTTTGKVFYESIEMSADA